MAQELEKIAGNNGSKLITGTSANAINHTALYVREDTVINVLTGVNDLGAATDYKVSLGLSGATLKAGDYYCVPMNNKLTALTLTSGSVILY